MLPRLGMYRASQCSSSRTRAPVVLAQAVGTIVAYLVFLSLRIRREESTRRNLPLRRRPPQTLTKSNICRTEGEVPCQLPIARAGVADARIVRVAVQLPGGALQAPTSRSSVRWRELFRPQVRPICLHSVRIHVQRQYFKKGSSERASPRAKRSIPNFTLTA